MASTTSYPLDRCANYFVRGALLYKKLYDNFIETHNAQNYLNSGEFINAARKSAERGIQEALRTNGVQLENANDQINFESGLAFARANYHSRNFDRLLETTFSRLTNPTGDYYRQWQDWDGDKRLDILYWTEEGDDPTEKIKDGILKGLSRLFGGGTAYASEGNMDSLYNSGQSWPPPPRDPLAFDLDGDGIETVSADAGITFDHDGDGLKQGTGWVKGDDGLLAIDRNGNGAVDNGGELFGDNTVRSDGSGLCGGAFEALAQEDTNGDGVVDRLDKNWDKLRVWRDMNQDGVSQADELFTMEELGITGLNLDKVDKNQNIAGGRLVGQGTYNKADGSTGQTGELELSENPFYREFTDEIEIPADIASLPNMYGCGAVRDLLEAA